ncbi:MAG TPA: dephospho-CoA kinase [Thermoanaerobaculia bacterium]|nr:dephospho-CoA kinase [Thermoanaerobaculia bacterium]
MILRVGLTGGIATGKSTISRIFAGLGCVTIDADAIVSRLYRPGGAGHNALVGAYGREILTASGEIDRKKVADIAFADRQSAKQLNALIHPLVIAEEKRIMAAEESRFPERDRIFIVEATLLLESGGKERYDKIVVVDVDPETQENRAVMRGVMRQDARRRMKHQMPREERLRAADYVIDNSGDRRSAEIETLRVYEKLREDLEKKKKK